MTIIRLAERKTDFVVLAKECLYESELSWGARAIHTYLMSKPNDWEVRVAELVNSGPQGRDAIYKYLNELIALGYIHRIIERNAKGQLNPAVYIVYEIKQPYRDDAPSKIKRITPHPENPQSNKKPNPEKPEVGKNPRPENPDRVLPDRAKPTLLNNKITKEGNKQAAESEQLPETAAACLPGLTPEQAHLVMKRFMQAEINLQKLNASVWLKAMAQELSNPVAFKNCETFGHKLNALLQQAKQGLWSPVSMQAVTAEPADSNNKQKTLRQKLATYRREKISWEQVIKNPEPYQDELYLASCRNELATVERHIHETTQLLSELEQTTQLQKEPHCARI